MASIELHHILVKSPLLADDILQQLEDGREFSDLAKEFSCCPSKNNQGNAGHHDQEQLPEALIYALTHHDPQQAFSGKIQTEYGYHILQPNGQVPDSLITDHDVASEN